MQRIRPIAEFYLNLAQYPTELPSSTDTPNAEQVALLTSCLSQAAGVRVPAALARISVQKRARPASRVKFGLHRIDGREPVTFKQDKELDPPDKERSHRFFLIYKSYRRYLQKTFIGKQRWALKLCALGVSGVDAADARDPVATRNACAILIWRHLAEDRDGPRLTMFFRYFHIDDHRRIARTAEERRWINNHFFAEELKSSFQKSLLFAERMMEVGRYFYGAKMFAGLGSPNCLAIRRHHSDKIQFFSWNNNPRNLIRQRVDEMVAIQDRHADLLRHIAVVSRKRSILHAQ